MKNCRQCGNPVFGNGDFCCEDCREIYDKKHPGRRKNEFITGLIVCIIICAILAKLPSCLMK